MELETAIARVRLLYGIMIFVMLGGALILVASFLTGSEMSLLVIILSIVVFLLPIIASPFVKMDGSFKACRRAMVVVYLALVLGCISLTIWVGELYDESSIDPLLNAMAFAIIAIVGYLVYVAIISIYFMIATKAHNNSAEVLSTDFNDNLRRVLHTIDRINGTQVEEEPAAATGKKRFGREKNEAEW